MASTLLKRASSSAMRSAVVGGSSRSYAAVALGTDLVSAAPGVSLQKAPSSDEGVSSKFATTPLKDILKDKKVVIFGLPRWDTPYRSKHKLPSYNNNMDKFKAKGIDSVICVFAVNDPLISSGWAGKLWDFEFYGDFDESFHKSLLGPGSERWWWSAYVVDGKVKALNVEEGPTGYDEWGGLSGGDVILGQI